MKQEEIVNLLLKVIPSPAKIDNLDLSQDNEVKFGYRGSNFRISENLFVEECIKGLLYITAASVFLEQLLKNRKKYYAD